MTKEEFLREKFLAASDKYRKNHAAFYANPSVARIAPFKIADRLYYVGDKKVCVHLIDTGDGLVLLDSGYLGAEHLLIDSIWRAGFDPADVRWIIHSHGHSDHFGASSEFKNMFGTKLAISSVDGRRVEALGAAAVPRKDYPYAPVPVFDRLLEDGEVWQIGEVKFRFVLTPGHTPGVLSIFFEVTDEGKTYLAGMFGGAGVNAIAIQRLLLGMNDPDAPQQMLQSIDKIWDEPVVVHLGNHPYNSKTLEKREEQLLHGGNPFVAPESWHSFLTELREKVQQVMADNEKLAQEMEAMGLQ
jgi:metallo-beta-lactamase class B